MSKCFHIWFSWLRAFLDPQPLPSLNGLFSICKQTEYLQYTSSSSVNQCLQKSMSTVHCKVCPPLILLREHPLLLQGVSEEALWRGVGTSGRVLHGLKLLREGEDKDTDMLVFFFFFFYIILFFKLIESHFLVRNTKENILKNVQHWIPLTFIVRKKKTHKDISKYFLLCSIEEFSSQNPWNKISTWNTIFLFQLLFL